MPVQCHTSLHQGHYRDGLTDRYKVEPLRNEATLHIPVVTIDRTHAVATPSGHGFKQNARKSDEKKRINL